MEFDLVNLFLSLFLTCVSYMIVPIILKIRRNSYEENTAKLISLVNSVVVGLIYFILTLIFLHGSAVWSAGPACLYYGINYWLLKEKTTATKNKLQKKSRNVRLLIIFGFAILAISAVVIIGIFTNKDFENKVEQNKYRARHILVSDYETAFTIIELLKSNYDFCELAKNFSEDTSTYENCGDVGYFEEGDMVSEFENVVKKMGYNEYTRTPVKTDFGYHVIMKIK